MSEIRRGIMAFDKGKSRFVGILLSIILLAGFYIRVDSLPNWLNNTERYCFGEESIPMMLTVDSYFYLNQALDLQEGRYSDFDERRHVPVGYEQTPTPSLLSVLLASINSLSGAGLEWVALLLPAFLGVLLAVPVYLLTSELTMKARGACIHKPPLYVASQVAALSAAFIALLSPMFVARSSVGWCDTDVLNVAFPVLLSWLAIRLADSVSLKQQFAFFSAFTLTSLLFLWWWDQSHLPVFAFMAIPFGLAFIFSAMKTSGRALPILFFGLFLLVIIGCWKGFHLLNPSTYFDSLLGMKQYISSETGVSPFRAAGASVSEQSHTPFEMVVEQSSGSWPAFGLACCGLLALVWLVRGYVLFLVPLVVVAGLAVKGQRFLIFTAPLFGLGIGTLCFIIYHCIRQRVWQVLALCLLLLVASWGAIRMEEEYDERAPRRGPVLFDAMKAVNDKTEEDAVVWASWGHGHPLLFYGQRGVVADGMFHSGELQYVLNFPLAAADFRLAANWMSFYVVNGPQGLRRANKLFGGGSLNWAEGMAALQSLLGDGIAKSRNTLQSKYHLSRDEVEESLQWLFPGTPKPVYLFLDYLLPTQAWFVLGRWDLVSRSAPAGSFFLPLAGVHVVENETIRGMSRLGRVAVDLETGQLRSKREVVALSTLEIYDGKEMRSREYDNSSSISAAIFLPLNKGVIGGEQINNTLLVRLYYNYTYDSLYFQPKDVGRPYYAIWQVTGEHYKGP